MVRLSKESKLSKFAVSRIIRILCISCVTNFNYTFKIDLFVISLLGPIHDDVINNLKTLG